MSILSLSLSLSPSLSLSLSLSPSLSPLTTEKISDDEEADIPPQYDSFVTPPTQRRPPPSSLPTDLRSQPVPPPSTTPHSSGSTSGASRLSVGSSERGEAISPRAQYKKWASMASNSFDLSGDEGGTPAVFGKQDCYAVLPTFFTFTRQFIIIIFLNVLCTHSGTSKQWTHLE